MGCFSFMCKGCGRPILSNSFKGQAVRLFLLKDGNVIEKMKGDYDSYGRVFGQKWSMEWRDVCGLIYSNNNGDGIAAIHERCYWEGYEPGTLSENDPGQGWGEPTCDEEKY